MESGKGCHLAGALPFFSSTPTGSEIDLQLVKRRPRLSILIGNDFQILERIQEKNFLLASEPFEIYWNERRTAEIRPECSSGR